MRDFFIEVMAMWVQKGEDKRLPIQIWWAPPPVLTRGQTSPTCFHWITLTVYSAVDHNLYDYLFLSDQKSDNHNHCLLYNASVKARKETWSTDKMMYS